jgi:hypothetical protein
VIKTVARRPADPRRGTMDAAPEDGGSKMALVSAMEARLIENPGSSDIRTSNSGVVMAVPPPAMYRRLAVVRVFEGRRRPVSMVLLDA